MPRSTPRTSIGLPDRDMVTTELWCTESQFFPIYDTLGAVSMPIAGLYGWAACESNCWPVILTAGLGAAAWATSAVYGYKYTGECRRMNAELRARPPGPASRTGDDPRDADPGGLRLTSLCLDTPPPRAERPAAAPLTGSGASP